jgi:hypothetical protein
MTKGGQLRLCHDAMEQDCKWAFRCWPCALPDQKNGATAHGLATNWHMAPWRKPPCPSLPSEALTRDRLVTPEKVECPQQLHICTNRKIALELACGICVLYRSVYSIGRAHVSIYRHLYRVIERRSAGSCCGHAHRVCATALAAGGHLRVARWCPSAVCRERRRQYGHGVTGRVRGCNLRLHQQQRGDSCFS